MAPKNKDLNARVKAFVDRRRNIIDRDLEDLKESRGFGSGFGFNKRDRELRGEKGRAETTTNVTRPWFNAVISAYNANPFTISARRYDGSDTSAMGDILDYQTTKCDLADVAAQVLEDMLNDGYGYFLVDTAFDNPDAGTQIASVRRLDNSRVFMDECENPTGADCQMAVYVDLLRKDTAEDRYDIPRRELSRATDPFADIAYFGKNSTEYTSIATVYEMTQRGCEISVLVHGRQVGKTVLFPGLTRLPIVRAAAEKVWLESEEQWTYRGAYWFVFSLVKKINYEMSAQVEAVATKPLTKFLAPKGSFTGLTDQLSDVHKNPRLYLEYNAIDATGAAIPAPTPYGDNALATGLMDDVEKTNALVASILGSPTAEASANETEESVLLRKGNQEATVSRFLKALKEALEEVGRVMLDMAPALFPGERQADGRILPRVDDASAYYVQIDKGPMVQSQQQRSIAILMALSKIITASPGNPAVALIIKNSELSQEDKDALLKALAPQGGALPPEAQQAMAAKDQQIAQMQQALAESQKNVAALQTNLNIMLDDTQNKYRIAVLDNQTKMNIERMKLAANDAKLQAQIQADFARQQQDIQADILKESMKLRAQAPTVPVFNDGRFV